MEYHSQTFVVKAKTLHKGDLETLAGLVEKTVLGGFCMSLEHEVSLAHLVLHKRHGPIKLSKAVIGSSPLAEVSVEVVDEVLQFVDLISLLG